MSMYDPIWDTLKANLTASVVVNRHHHARIIKAVKKRKWLDLGFKLRIEPQIATLSHVRSGNTITFYLHLHQDLNRLRYDTKGKLIL